MQIQNFKSWRDTGKMRLAPITGLFGTNSSGKTSILQLLLMLKQTAQSADRAQVVDYGDDKALVSLGSFGEVVHRHDADATMEWSLGWNHGATLTVEDPREAKKTLLSGSALSFRASIRQVGGRPTVEKMDYGVAGHRFGMVRKKDGYELCAEPAHFRFRRSRGRGWSLPPPVKCYGFPDQTRAYYQNAGFLSDMELALEEFLGRVYYLGPLREDPKRVYTWAGGQPADMGRRGERVVEALLASRDRKERISRGRGAGRTAVTVEQRVAMWLKELKLIHDFGVEAVTKGGSLYRVWVRRTPQSARVLLPDVGFGVSQVLPVLALCYYVPKGSVILLEQPEIHLHPCVQSGLADVFLDAMRHRDVQIILESHSEHLLLRLQRRLAEEYRVPGHAAAFTPKDAALYFCDVVDGASRLVPLDLDEYGNIRNWPEDFFGDQFGETAKMMDAAMDRKKRLAA
jgi:predicted ATPase